MKNASTIKLQRDASLQAKDKAIEIQETLSEFLELLNLPDDSTELLEKAEIEHATLMKETHEQTQLAKNLGPIWVGSGFNWAAIWDPSGQPRYNPSGLCG